MTEKGFIICRPESETTPNNLEYLLENDNNEIRHFASEEEAGEFLKEKEINDETIMIKYHDFCHRCAKEFFFDTTELPEDTGFYLCKNCMKHYV